MKSSAAHYCANLLGMAASLCLSGSESANYIKEMLPELPGGGPEHLFFDETSPEAVSILGKPTAFDFSWHNIDHPKFERFVRVEVLEQTEKSHDVLLHTASNPKPIQANDWILASFHARAGGGKGTAAFRGYLERNAPAWSSLGETGGVVSVSWNRFIALGKAEQYLEPGSLKLSVHLGLKPQVVDFAGISILNLGPDIDPETIPVSSIAYEGIAPDAPWRAEAEARISQHRKGPLTLRVTGADGRPLEGCAVELELTRHAYQFGTFFSRLAIEENEMGERYREWMKDNFNFATTPVYWADWGWANSKRREEYIKMADWIRNERMPARAHVLLYPGWKFAPGKLRALSKDPAAFKAEILRHLEEIVPMMSCRGIHEYDVVNELYHLKDFTDIVGMDEVAVWFKKVKELDPDSILYINENSILTDGGVNRARQDHYYELIQFLLDRGAPLDGIGMQGHFSEAVTPPPVLWSILDRFAAFGLPIRITEYDLNTRDRAGQASYDRDFYTAVFAHPATVGITRWGFYEIPMWRPLGALIDRNGEYKPNGLEHRKLLFETWHTKESGKTAADGLFQRDAFYGRYRVVVQNEGDTREFEIDFKKSSAESCAKPIQVRWTPK